jgi:hypothetical protein
MVTRNSAAQFIADIILSASTAALEMLVPSAVLLAFNNYLNIFKN